VLELPESTVSELCKRLRRAAGQVNGVERMLLEKRDCAEVLTQLSAARHALEQTSFKLLAASFLYCQEHPETAAAEGYGPEAFEKLFLRLS
jgi:DNA-binding FrmR family transcriptional regulator